jgi:hypothetical protein
MLTTAFPMIPLCAAANAVAGAGAGAAAVQYSALTVNTTTGLKRYL